MLPTEHMQNRRKYKRIAMKALLQNQSLVERTLQRAVKNQESFSDMIAKDAATFADKMMAEDEEHFANNPEAQ